MQENGANCGKVFFGRNHCEMAQGYECGEATIHRALHAANQGSYLLKSWRKIPLITPQLMVTVRPARPQ
jgi:hypothetical protein